MARQPLNFLFHGKHSKIFLHAHSFLLSASFRRLNVKVKSFSEVENLLKDVSIVIYDGLGPRTTRQQHLKATERSFVLIAHSPLLHELFPMFRTVVPHITRWLIVKSVGLFFYNIWLHQNVAEKVFFAKRTI